MVQIRHLNQLANVGVEDARTLIVQPYERAMIAVIDKAIRNSDLGLNPFQAMLFVFLYLH
jgi:ribosome recycling factor